MTPVLLVVDVQPSFEPPAWLVQRVAALAGRLPSIATVERHDEDRVPFRRQLGWAPGPMDESLVAVDRVFVKHGYCPPPALVDYLRELRATRVFVCGLQAETCVLAAGFSLFDAGLAPTLVTDLVVGSSLDRSGELGARLWKHHFGAVIESEQLTKDLETDDASTPPT